MVYLLGVLTLLRYYRLAQVIMRSAINGRVVEHLDLDGMLTTGCYLGGIEGKKGG